MKAFAKTLKRIGIITASGVLLAAAAHAQDATPNTVTVPNTFVAGTPARAADVNENFDVLAASLNAQAQSLDNLTSQGFSERLVCIPRPGSDSVVQFFFAVARGDSGSRRLDCIDLTDPTVLIRPEYPDLLAGGWMLTGIDNGYYVFFGR